ncbi:MAG TPA: hypothetical protein VE865_08345 [Bradyrhizobium sp.]|nr:hypothetical protein [Bradyrhizobium sp.]
MNTHLPAFAVSAPGFVAGSFGATFGVLLVNGLRALAGGAAFARTGADGFDFAAAFLVFDPALAMAVRSPATEKKEGKECAPYTTFCAFDASLWNRV